MATEKRFVYRVRNIPHFVKEKYGVDNGLDTLLADALDDPDVSASHIKVKSLAASTSAYDDHRVATVMFTRLPSLLGEGGSDEWLVRATNIPEPLIIDRHFKGFTALSDSWGTSFDCIALSGLASHPFGSWQPKGGGDDFMWIRDLLPEKLRTVRVIIYGYETPLKNSNSCKTIPEIARALTDALIAERLGFSSLMVFLAHSLGGIVLKEMIVQLPAGSEGEKSLLNKTLGAIMFGVPNWGILNGQWLPMVKDRPNEALVHDLGLKSQYLMSLDKRFTNFSKIHDLLLFWAYERKTSPVTFNGNRYATDGPEKLLVTPESATRGEADVPTARGEWRVFSIDENHSNMVKFRRGDQISLSVVHKIQEIIKSPKQLDTTTQARAGHRGDKDADLVASLAFAEQDRRLDQVEGNVHGSFEWVLESGPGLAEWAQSDAGLFWIHGKPGSGKSTLMKFICNDVRIRELLTTSSRDAQVVFAPFFFHLRGSEIQRSYLGLLRTLLHSVLKQSPRLLSSLSDIIEDRKKWEEESKKLSVRDSNVSIYQRTEEFWTFNRLRQTLGLILDQQKYRLDICIFLDALDEYNGPPDAIGKIISDLVEPARVDGLHRAYTRVKVCFSSREWTVFFKRFQGRPGFALQDYTRPDMRRYCQYRINTVTNRSPASLQRFIPDLVDRSCGVFLWLKLAMDDLVKLAREQHSDTIIWSALDNVPSELEDYYVQTLLRLPESDRWHAFALLEVAARDTIISRGAFTTRRVAFDISGSILCSDCTTVQDAMRRIESLLKAFPTPTAVSIEAAEVFAKKVSGGLVEAKRFRNTFGETGVKFELMHQTVRDLVLRPNFRHLVLPRHLHSTVENGFSFVAKYILALNLLFPDAIKGTIPRPWEAFWQAEITVGLSQLAYIRSVPDRARHLLCEAFMPGHLENLAGTSPLVPIAARFRLQLLLEDAQQQNPRMLSDCRVPLLSILLDNDLHSMSRFIAPEGVIKFILESGYNVAHDPKAFHDVVKQLDHVYHPSQPDLDKPKLGTLEQAIEDERNIMLAILMLEHGQHMGATIWIWEPALHGSPLTALHFAPARLLRWLLEHGMDPNTLSPTGFTALDTRCRGDYQRRELLAWEKPSRFSVRRDDQMLPPTYPAPLDDIHETTKLLVECGGVAPNTRERDVRRLSKLRPDLDWSHLTMGTVVGQQPPRRSMVLPIR